MIRRFRKPDPVAVLQNRNKWRDEFEQHLRKRDASGTRGDSIIRDVTREVQRPHDGVLPLDGDFHDLRARVGDRWHQP